MSNSSDSTKALPGGNLGSIIIIIIMIIIIIIAVYLSNDARQYNKRLIGLNKESWLGGSCLLLLFICSMECGAYWFNRLVR